MKKAVRTTRMETIQMDPNSAEFKARIAKDHAQASKRNYGLNDFLYRAGGMKIGCL